MTHFCDLSPLLVQLKDKPKIQTRTNLRLHYYSLDESMHGGELAQQRNLPVQGPVEHESLHRLHGH